MPQDSPDRDVTEKTRSREKIRLPQRYTVVFHNDNYTTQEFVVMVLMKVFQQDQASATRIMYSVHKKGRGSVGNYPLDIARSKASRAETLAQEKQYPLRLTVEPLN